MKKTKKALITIVLATFFLSMPLFSEARAVGETQLVSLDSSLLELHQSSGVGRMRSSRRRQVRRRRSWRRRQVRHVRRHNRTVRRRSRTRSGHDH